MRPEAPKLPKPNSKEPTDAVREHKLVVGEGARAQRQWELHAPRLTGALETQHPGAAESTLH